jgi:FKBP-type peptidyl-prolyl cis-trans isomerase FkpA
MRRHLSFVVAAGFLLSLSCGKRQSGTPEIKTDEQKTFYALGLMLGRNVGVFNMTQAELEIVKAGLSDAVLKKKPVVEMEAFGPKVDGLARARSTAAAAGEKGKAKGVLDKAEKEPGAVKTPSGLVFRTIKPGTGASPAATDKVKVHYHGTLPDGTVFDSSVKRGQPVDFPLNGVIKCWTEGVQKMKVGEKAKLTCPAEIAYGENGRPPVIPGGATLIFEVDLLEIVK